MCFSAYSLWIFLSVQIGFQKDCNLLALWLNQPLLIMHCIAFPKLRYWMHTSFWPNYLESCGYGRGLVSVCLCLLLNSLIWCYCREVASKSESSVQLFPRAWLRMHFECSRGIWDITQTLQWDFSTVQTYSGPSITCSLWNCWHVLQGLAAFPAHSDVAFFSLLTTSLHLLKYLGYCRLHYQNKIGSKVLWTISLSFL